MSHKLKESLPVLVVGALGVVFGDIGTSPLYAIKVCFSGRLMEILDRFRDIHCMTFLAEEFDHSHSLQLIWGMLRTIRRDMQNLGE